MAVLEKEAKVTAQGQITVPAQIRDVLGVAPGDLITFSVDADGTVMVRNSGEPDATFAAFLDFLDQDIQRHPANVEALTSPLEQRLRNLTAHTIIDRENDVIEGDVGF